MSIELFNADCLLKMKDFDSNSIDLTITSPPYDNLRTYKGYTFDFEGIARELYRITKKGGVVVWVVGDATINGSETGTSFKQALFFKEIGFNLHDTMIWKKDNPIPLNHNRYEPCFEYMFIFSKGNPKTFNPIKEKTQCAGKFHSWDNFYRESGTAHRPRKEKTIGKEYKIKNNVWELSISNTEFNHPAIFPEKLAEDHLLSWSNEGNLVLDPMCGSGTVGKMCAKHNRNFIGIDIAKEYIDIAQKRIQAVLDQYKLQF